MNDTHCNCAVMVATIDAALARLSAIPRDTGRIGTPAVVAVENLFRRQRADVLARHERDCLRHPTPSLVPMSLEERQGS